MNELSTKHIAREVGAAETMVSDVVARLRLVRGDLSDDGFAALVRDVVRTKLRFAERDANENLSSVRLRPLDD